MLERVRKTRKPILITHSDGPLAVIVPLATQKDVTARLRTKSGSPFGRRRSRFV